MKKDESIALRVKMFRRWLDILFKKANKEKGNVDLWIFNYRDKSETESLIGAKE
jgi:hypothetical protein